MAKTKQGGKTRQHSTRPGKRLGLKLSGGQKAKVGMIILRQRGTKYHPGNGVKMGRDHTIFAIKEGVVEFKKRLGRLFVNVN